ncbi:helix-turn-helix transcriptional regulator [Heyndrickxia sp. MSNUG]|uniref:helix-turn-helix transcriptional regulator n=1 Tax=Heyndrickxia sp. MSNUG TaxID=3136677 RepID=UPI003C30E911
MVGKCLLSDRLLQVRMTQQELAEQLGVTRQQINSYTTNKRIMSLVTAKNIAFIVKCDITDLYEWVLVDDRNKRQ